MSSFNALLLGISDQLNSQQLEKLKFLCRTMVGKREAEKITSGLQLFCCLIERGQLKQDQTELLSQFLKEIERQDLADKLENFHTPEECTSNQPCPAEKAKLDIATNVIAENLGRTWRKLGRKLGLSESKLDSVAARYPTDLEETARELLKDWRKSRGAEALAKDLIEALRACQQNLTADKVEDRIACI
ncbi:protein FADD [Dunckerocampus dactyliophorus]|uniref:protein FADD n=1 Tax=Dunckerocampus dactyliophorus TaxID=161453 RepID=UPI0024064EF6|nr:protein FADD [Dunckerocampus dactyliophorus]